MNRGYIKIYRAIEDHWIFQSDAYFRAWSIILFKVNHCDKKVLIHGEVFDCKRGQSLLSLQSWADRFKGDWSYQKVRTFFNLLENDKMIITEGIRKTTRLTVCNYDTYQSDQQSDNEQTTDKQQSDNEQVTSKQQSDNEQVTSKQRQLKNVKNDKHLNNDKNDNNNSGEREKQFSDFWEYYGKKQDREKCHSKFLKLSESDVIKIRETLPAYIKSTPEIKYRKNPLTYLNGKCWNDEPVVEKSDYDKTHDALMDHFNNRNNPKHTDPFLEMFSPKLIQNQIEVKND